MDLFEKRRKAFTIIELIVVIAIIIILVGIGIPFTSNVIAERSLYNAAAQVQQDILLIQNLAITHSSDNAARFRIRFFPQSNEYRIETTEDANIVSGKGKLIKRQFASTVGFPLFFDKNVPDSVVFGVKSCPPSSYLDVSFNNSGVPHTGGGHINLINSTNTMQIRVIVSVIGRVRIEWVKK
jgi:type II secretory pathway pseudopilin PulG